MQRTILVRADQPTTAPDATVQIRVLLLRRELQAALGLSVIFVTHDIGAAVDVADRIVEHGTVRQLIRSPPHPCTPAQLQSRVQGALAAGADGPLATIAGSPPDLAALPAGCAFAKRCPLASEIRRQTRSEPVLLAPGHTARCHHSDATTATLPVPS